MNTMLNETALTFKDFEKKTFQMVCEWARNYTKEFLERYDDYLMESRDKEAYRNKGKRRTTVKTVYGEVEYERRIYEVIREDGLKEFVYLLDEQLEISGVGLISMNMAEQMVSSITETSYRETASRISETTGQSISAMGVWNVIQSLGESVCEDERQMHVLDARAVAAAGLARAGEDVEHLMVVHFVDEFGRFRRKLMVEGPALREDILRRGGGGVFYSVQRARDGFIDPVKADPAPEEQPHRREQGQRL